MQRKQNNTPFIILLFLIIAFSAYVISTEKAGFTKAQQRINEHAKIIADDLWNYNRSGAAEYLELAAQSDRYEKLTIINNNGDVFYQIKSPADSRVDLLLSKLNLTHRVYLIATIEYDSNLIGWIEATWRPATLVSHLLVLGFILLVWLVFILYMRIINQNKLLEERVKKRTEQLMATNRSLTEEISVRAKTENALHLSEQKYRFLAENMGEVIWTLNRDKRCTYMSPVSYSMYGWSAGELEGKKLDLLFSTEGYALFESLLDEALGQPNHEPGPSASKVLEFEMHNKTGTIIWCEIALTFVALDDGQIDSIMCVSRNVTERKLVESDHKKLHERVERLKKMESLGLLAGGVAHDLNNVLSGIVSYPELILLDLPVDSPLRKRIEILQDSGKKAAEIVQDLLALARRGVSHFKPININTLIQEYFDSPEFAQLQQYHKSIVFEQHTSNNIALFAGSTVHLKKIIMNLISNAAEAQPNGGKISIFTHTVHFKEPIEGYQQIPKGKYVLFSVTDDGEGISDEEVKHIFEPFYTRKVMGRSGTGLGLTVVWGTVEDHNGYIDITTQKYVGTSINLYFPVMDDQKAVDDDIFSLDIIKGDNEEILVVDDDKRQREIATDILQRLNYSPVSVSSGEEAVTYLRDNDPDLVILDMIMEKGMDGFETYEQIVKINAQQKVIIASGYSPTERVEKAQELGAGKYLQKPYSIKDISKAIHESLSRE